MIEARLNPDWYRVKYNLAALHANWASEETVPETAREEQLCAHSEAKELAEKALEQLVSPPDKASPELLSLLRNSILPAALVIYAGTSLRDIDVGEDPGVPGSPGELLDLLRSDLSPRAAMGYVSKTQRPTPRVLYNLACVHAQQGELEEAADYLSKAIQTGPERSRKQLAQRSLEDPSLRPLREAENPSTREKALQDHIDGIVKAYVPSSRYRVDIVGETEAAAEAEQAAGELAEEPAAEAEAEETE